MSVQLGFFLFLGVVTGGEPGADTGCSRHWRFAGDSPQLTWTSLGTGARHDTWFSCRFRLAGDPAKATGERPATSPGDTHTRPGQRGAAGDRREALHIGTGPPLWCSCCGRLAADKSLCAAARPGTCWPCWLCIPGEASMCTSEEVAAAAWPDASSSAHICVACIVCWSLFACPPLSLVVSAALGGAASLVRSLV